MYSSHLFTAVGGECHQAQSVFSFPSLVIRIYREEDWMVVENELRPVVSELVSTGIGHRNITGRYFLLCQKKPLIVKSKELYQVKLPVIHKEPCTY